MLCTFCGTENGPENKFCGMCGVRLERRKAERRARYDSLKCQSCGQPSEKGQKFCGMCGSRVERRAQDRRAGALVQPRATAAANAQLPSPEAIGPGTPSAPAAVASASPRETFVPPVSEIPESPRTSPAIFRDQPPRTTIGGHSFLGLSDEPESDGQYLLEEENSSGGVLRKLVLIAILAAIAGLIFVGWRSGFLANSKLLQPSKAQPSASPSPLGGTPDSAPTPSDGAKDGAKKDFARSDAPDRPTPVPAASDTQETLGVDKQALAAAGGEEKRLDVPGAKPTAVKAKTSPETTTGFRHPSAALVQAQNYLQGKGGVKQNCEEGLLYLKAATEKNEPAADVQMGALYASGHCVQQDRVTAYRWFNSAHELDPANPWIQTNLDQLWGQMTLQEQQRAGH